MKKLLSLVLALTMVLSLSVTAFAAENYPDILYVDISRVIVTDKTIERVKGDAGDAEIVPELLSGYLYAFDMSQANDDLTITITYAGGGDEKLSVPQAEAGKNRYTFTGSNEGSWDTYNVPTVTNGTQNVTGKYAPATESNPVYKVDISWGSMAFTYTAASKGTWSTSSHIYEGAKDAAWSWAEGANEIKVTNHSNDDIAVTPSYTADSDYSAVSMNFSGSLILATADNGKDDAAGTATNDTINVTPSGDLPKDTDGKIGQITLKLEPLITISTAEDLADALAKDGAFKLDNDITMENNDRIKNTIVLDLNNCTLTVVNKGLYVNKGGGR